MTIRHLDVLLRPQTVVCIGVASDPHAAQLFEHLRQSAGIHLLGCNEHLEGWPAGQGRTVALLADARLASVELIAALGARGCHALLWPQSVEPLPALLRETRRQGMRLLGPRCGGVANPALPLQALSIPGEPATGGLALIAQSRSIAAAALDWAAGRHLGFSWVAVTGAEADVDVADLLDYAALDGTTRSVVLQLSHIRSGRKFMSAARACARLKPVVVLQSQPTARIGQGADPVRSSAFARAGLVECESLPGLFDALAALQRLPVVQQPGAVVIGNGAGICALGVDALARQGLAPLSPTPALAARLPAFRNAGGALDVGHLPASQLAAALTTLLGDATLPAVLLLHSPAPGCGHLELATQLIHTSDPRLLTVWLGLDTALPARAACASAGLPTFTSADSAARALRYRWQYHRNRELLTQTPPPQRPLALGPGALRESLHALAQRCDASPVTEPLQALLSAYGLQPAPRAPVIELNLRVASHAELGQHLQLSRGERAPAFAFAPLDLLLAGRLLDQVGVDATQAEYLPLCRLLTQLAQLVIDQPSIAALTLALSARGDEAGWQRDAAVLQLVAVAPVERQRLVLAPYPAELSAEIEDRAARRYQLRPIQPSDEPSVIALLERLDPEEVRLRFFGHIRHFSHAMGARMTQIDYDRELSFVLLAGQDESEAVIAIATLIADPDGQRAEFALLVQHDFSGAGLGSLLLQRLLQHAAQQGIQQVFGTVLAENEAMLGAARRLGFSQRPEPGERGCLRVEIDIPA